MKMNPEIKARWVAALRSGEYKQTKMKLRYKGGHCCLGVLCDLFAQERGTGWRTRELSEAGPRQGYQGHCFPDNNLPGAEVCIWAGIDPYADVPLKGVRQPLYEHNDDGASFAEIADAIESQL